MDHPLQRTARTRGSPYERQQHRGQRRASRWNTRQSSWAQGSARRRRGKVVGAGAASGAVGVDCLLLGPDVPVDEMRLLGKEVSAEVADHGRRTTTIVAKIENDRAAVAKKVHGCRGGRECVIAMGEPVEAEIVDPSGKDLGFHKTVVASTQDLLARSTSAGSAFCSAACSSPGRANCAGAGRTCMRMARIVKPAHGPATGGMPWIGSAWNLLVVQDLAAGPGSFFQVHSPRCARCRTPRHKSLLPSQPHCQESARGSRRKGRPLNRKPPLQEPAVQTDY